MALIYSGMKCAICGQVISDELLNANKYVATSHFIGDPAHPLWCFSDAAMHIPCFMAWGNRQEFVQTYNDTVGKITRSNGTHHYMNDDGEVISVKD